MAKWFVQFWPLTYKLVQNFTKNSLNLLQFLTDFKLSTKWHNLAKSGHTALYLLLDIVNLFVSLFTNNNSFDFPRFDFGGNNLLSPLPRVTVII